VVGLAATAAPQREEPFLQDPQTTLEMLEARTSQGIFPVKKNGKNPLTDHGFKNASYDLKQIERWKQEFPGCNWGAPTGNTFVVLDLDAKHPESFEWWREQQDIHGLVETHEVSTPSGGIHLYFLPPAVKLKSTASQIAPGVDTRAQGGYVVIPPSCIDGNPYEVANDVPIAEMPSWLLEVWPKVGQQRQREYSPEERRVNVGAGIDLLNTPLPERQRNVGLARIAGHLWNRLETLQELEGELLEANARLCDPPLPNDEVLAIARSISRYPQKTPSANDNELLSWDEVQAAVAYNPCAGYFKQGLAGPRRRFPLHGDRAAIRHIRQRLNPIWMETQQRLGHQGVYDRADKCGHLPARECNDCKTTFSESSNHRYNCRAHLHPLCMGTQARKPLWNAQERLEAEEQLQISIIQLGVYDIGADPFHWAPKIRDVSKQAHAWIRRLTDRKDCPESISTSFLGFRYDLHDGFLTLDVVLMSAAGPDDTNYLRDYFSQATEQAVKIDSIQTHSVDDSIGTFGNLMSSAIIYDDTYGCAAFLEGLKGQRMVQGRGRFRKPLDTREDKSAFVSNNPIGDVLETNADAGQPKAGGGPPPTKCPECGSTHTTYLGRLPGDWRKVKSQATRQWYWRLDESLEEDNPDGQTRPGT
jgi:hypothetical protein